MRWTKRKLIILNTLLWFITFGIVLPLMAQKWVFSPFFYNSKDFRTRASKFVDKLNTERYNTTEQYLKRIDSAANKDLHTRNLKTATMVAVIITKRRQWCTGNGFNCEPHYLQQVAAALDEDVKVFVSQSGMNVSQSFVPIVICNVDKQSDVHLDFSLLRQQFPVIMRYANNESLSGDTLRSTYSSRSDESLDYAYCLEATLKLSSPKYLLVLEDDAVPFKGITEKISYFLDYRIEHKMLHDSLTTEVKRWGWIKLYYPELWSGYGMEYSKLLELISIAVFGAGVFCLVYLALVKPKLNFILIFNLSTVGSLFVLLLVLIMTRQTFLELRRLHTFFFHISDDMGCCTPAVLFSTKWIAAIVEYLRSSECHRCRLGVDLALSDFREQNDLDCYLVEPNLVRHVGMHSTLTANKDPRSFLFYDFLYTEISNVIVGL